MTVITISGLPGCGSSTTGALLAEKLGLKFFSVGTYTKKIVREDEKIEKKQTEYAIDFWKTKRGKSRNHHVAVEVLQQKLAEEGDIVIESKLGIRFVKNSDFKIWLKAPTEARIKRYAQRDGNHEDKAKQQLEEKEKMERENWKRIYGFDYFDQEKEADLVIDTSDKSPEKIVDIIIKFMGNKK